MTGKLIMKSGVKQGCLMAPLFFNLFLNDLTPTLNRDKFHLPRHGAVELPILVCADNCYHNLLSGYNEQYNPSLKIVGNKV